MMSTGSNEFRARLYSTFQAEASQHIENLNDMSGKLDHVLEETDLSAILKEMYRAVHSLKGAAQSVEVAEVEVICLELERSIGGLIADGSKMPIGFQLQLRRYLQHIRERLFEDEFG